MKYLVCDIKNKKEAIIADLVKDVHIVASTADSWCKWKAGLISGTIAKCLKDKKPVVCFMDECESYGLLQTLASASQDFQTLVFLGDENQRLESHSQKYKTSPWQGPTKDSWQWDDLQLSESGKAVNLSFWQCPHEVGDA